MKHRTFTRRQQGAALIIGLILLVVITVLAVSGMNTATTELAMARNDQSAENAFQAAETGLEIALGQPTFRTDATMTINRNINAYDRVSVDVTFDRETIVTDRAFSLGVGSGISAFHFVATADASSERGGIGNATVRDASAVHTQAFYIVGPQGNTL
jgi:type IV pilus assembly protein PilX